MASFLVSIVCVLSKIVGAGSVAGRRIVRLTSPAVDFQDLVQVRLSKVYHAGRDCLLCRRVGCRWRNTSGHGLGGGRACRSRRRRDHSSRSAGEDIGPRGCRRPSARLARQVKCRGRRSGIGARLSQGTDSGCGRGVGPVFHRAPQCPLQGLLPVRFDGVSETDWEDRRRSRCLRPQTDGGQDQSQQ